MKQFSHGNFHGILSRPDFLQDVETMVYHQTAYAGQPDHEECAGLYYVMQNPPRIESSGVRYNHRDELTKAAEIRRYGHISAADWGNIGLYVTARSTIVPGQHDIDGLLALHDDNRYAIRGTVAEGFFGPNHLFLRPSESNFDPQRLAAHTWDEAMPLFACLDILSLAGINSYVKGAIDSQGSTYLQEQSLFG
jgi:hypothetical protein